MPMYDVQVDVAAVACLSIEADSPEEAEEFARDQWSHSDLQCGYITGIEVERDTTRTYREGLMLSDEDSAALAALVSPEEAERVAALREQYPVIP